MSRLYLGVDAGATKTHALVMNETGALLGFGAGGSGNHEGAGFSAAQKNLSQAVQAAVEMAEKGAAALARVCYSLAGCDVTSDYHDIPLYLIEPTTGQVPYDLKNDSFGCLRGGTRDPFGVMINCGTAQVAVGRNRAGKEVRLGGYGPNYGDFTGGMIITYQAVAAVVRAADGRGRRTRLTEEMLALSGQDNVDAFIDRTYRDEEYLLGLGIAPLVFRVSRGGDEVAKRIVLEAAEEMAVTATALIRKLEMQDEVFDVIAAGSVFKGEDPAFMETIEKAVHGIAPRATFRTPLYDPVVGAVLLAAEADGIAVTESMYARLEETLGIIV